MFIAFDILFTALEGFMIVFSFAIFSGLRDSILKYNTKMLFFIFIYTIYTYWLTLIVPAGFHTLLISVLTVITLNYLFQSRFFKSLIKAFMIFTFISLVEILISMFSLLIINVPLNILLSNNLYIFICSIISKAIELSSVIILYRVPLNIYWLNDSNPYISRYKQVLIIISTVMVFLVCGNIYLAGNPQKAYIFNTLSFIIYLVLLLAMVSAFREGSNLELLQYANEIQKENIQQLIDFNEMVAKERHEYKNHLNTIYGLCTLNKQDSLERIKQYINNYANNSSTKNISIASGNDFVDAIINVKYNNALRKGIDLRVDFGEPLFSANLEEDVAVTIISNIIENAFEAMHSVEKEGKFVQLYTYIQGDLYFISISNNGPMITESEKSKIFNAGYSTKDNPSNTRGFGLSIVQNEVTRNNGDIVLNSSEESTEFLITFKAKHKLALV